MRCSLAALLLLGLAAVRAHDYPPGGDCVRAHPSRPLTAAEVASGSPTDVVCRQKPAPDGALKVGCVGDSITAVGHTSGVAHHWPNQLQDILDTKAPGKFSVTNLGIVSPLQTPPSCSPHPPHKTSCLRPVRHDAERPRRLSLLALPRLQDPHLQQVGHHLHHARHQRCPGRRQRRAGALAESGVR